VLAGWLWEGNDSGSERETEGDGGRGRTLTDGAGCDEGAFGDHAGGGLLPRDTGDGGALWRLAEVMGELKGVHTEALRDWTSIVTSVDGQLLFFGAWMRP
jgi:hypothetical protein